jgi:predicted esterase
MGFSNGGNIAMQVAIRHPELVRRLVGVRAGRLVPMVEAFLDEDVR